MEPQTTPSEVVSVQSNGLASKVILLVKFFGVLFSWRFFKIFTRESILTGPLKDTPQPKKFSDKISDNFYALFTDIFGLIAFIIICTLFFWRAKQLFKLLILNDVKKWKKVIYNEFYGGLIQFGSVFLLLLVKWPVVFKVLWYMGTEQEEKATWSEIFMREFAPKNMTGEKNAYEKERKTVPTPSKGGKKGASTRGNGSTSSATTGDKSEEQWKFEFKRDLQNIGFEFDEFGEIKKFPPTEVMEQYQKSEKFKEMIFSANEIENHKKKQTTTTTTTSSSSTSPIKKDEPDIENYSKSSIYNPEDFEFHNEKAIQEQLEEEEGNDEPSSTQPKKTTTTTKKRKGKGRN